MASPLDRIPASAWRLAFGIAVAGVLYLALRPTHGQPDWFWQADKLRHIGAFATLWCLGRGTRMRWLAGWRLGVWLLGLGVLIEGLQALTPDREASALDVCADAVGLAVGAWLAPRLPAWLSRPAT